MVRSGINASPTANRAMRPQGTDPLGPLQFAVMEGLWSHSPATAAQLTRELNRGRSEPLSMKTILTCLTRLEEKGLVSHGKQSRAYVFSPTKSEDEVSTWYLMDRFRAIIDRFGDLAVAVFVELIGDDPVRYRFLRQLVRECDERGST